MFVDTTAIVEASSSEAKRIVSKKLFTSTAHELRTPLNAILGGTNQIRKICQTQKDIERINMMSS